MSIPIRRLCAAMLGLLVLTASAHYNPAPLVQVDVIDTAGRRLQSWPAPSESSGLTRTWLEARRGQRYRLRIHNPGAERLGLVIAVDGRNVISGARSTLHHDEAMYIIGPYQTQVITGWRTDANHVHAFYFTDQHHSYAAAWDDYSAMGTIAVSVFREQRQRQLVPHYRHRQQPFHDQRAAPGAGSAVPGEAQESYDAPERKKQSRSSDTEAGTGFGERQWSSARQVAFVPHAGEAFRQVFKYAWTSTLCHQGVKRCDTANRFWPSSGFAPHPPGH